MSADNINLEFIERYQKLYEKDPRSKVFAPLGEAYRKMGLIKEALLILETGVKLHPHFASGRVALAKVLIHENKHEEAVVQLLAATDLSPENLLAQKLLAESYIQLKKTKEAFKAFKMVLFLNPNDAHAQMHVKKLESLTADEYEDDIFEMKPLTDDISIKKMPNNQAPFGTISGAESGVYKFRQLERVISLADAFIVRMDLDKALETIRSSENLLGTHPELEKRKRFIAGRMKEHQDFLHDKSNSSELNAESNSQPNGQVEQKIDLLKDLLHKIESRR
jgi:tetratricopeptide (TPR) repeat protein